MLQLKCTNTLQNNHLKNILLAPKYGQIGARGYPRWMTNYTYLKTKGAVARASMNPCLSEDSTFMPWMDHQPADSPFMPCMDRQSTYSPKHTAEDGSIKVEDNPCNNYVARASHPASPGFSVAPSSKTFFQYLLCASLLTTHNKICMWRAFSHRVAIYVDRKLGEQQRMNWDGIGRNRKLHAYRPGR